MRFLYPSFLFALFAIIIPILIHFFSFRKFTTVYFSNVNYLQNIRKESQKKSRLKHLLILLLRILAIAALVFAFAQPYRPADKKNNHQADAVVSIYVDNSFSMNALSTQGQLLEVARNKAIEIAGVYPPGTRFRLITNDMLPQHQHVFNKEQFIQQISEIKSSPKSVPLSMIQNHLNSTLSGLDSQSGSTSFYLSDFQKKSADLRNLTGDSSHTNFFLPLSCDVPNNLYIDSCWMELPAHKIGQEEKLNVRIINSSKEAYQNLPLKFYLNDTLKALGNFNIEPGGEQVVELKYMNITGGLLLGYAEISDYPFTQDNTYYLSYRVQSHLQALAIYDSGYKSGTGLPYLRALFGDDNYVTLDETPVENLQLSKLSSYNTIFILNTRELSSGLINEIKKAAENGATVIFFPEPDGKMNQYNNLLGLMKANRITRLDTMRQQIAGLEWNHPVYEQVFRDRSDNISFPRIKGNYVFTEDIRIPETRLLWFRNNTKAVSTQSVGNGHLIVFSFPLSTLNDEFARDILFVPTIYSLVINSLPQQKIAYSIGEETFASVPLNTLSELSPVSVMNKETKQEFIPATTVSEGNILKINFSDFFDRAGHYLVFSKGNMISAISMNYDREESKLEFYSPEDLISEIGKNKIGFTYVIDNKNINFSEAIDKIQQGQKFWKIFIAIALLFIFVEAMIIRLWK